MRFLDPLDIALSHRRQWRPSKEPRPRLHRIAYHEPVFAERLFVEEYRWLERGKELLVDALRHQRQRVDTQRCQEPAGLRAVGCRRRNRMRTAVAEQQLSVHTELVARRVAAEVVVVVEEQDTR